MISNATPICVVIVGPTAVGKTIVAINLARILGTQIISADSRQCYKELSIGVAKPTVQQLNEIKHFFINSHSIRQDVNAALFEQFALESVKEIFENNDCAVVVGGTGLYIDAFCNGLDEIPVIIPEIRKNIITSYNENGITWLQEEVRITDPEYFKIGEILNPQRLMRALEVKRSSGRSIIFYQSRKKKKRDFDIIKIGLELPREILYEQINRRVDAMMENGLAQEAKNLLSFKQLNALNTVGYKELFSFFDGDLSLAGATALIKKNTRHYAKRQVTWFKNDRSIQWIHPDDQTTIAGLLKR